VSVGCTTGRRAYSRQGLNARKARVKVRGLQPIDQHTVAAQALLGWRRELVADPDPALGRLAGRLDPRARLTGQCPSPRSIPVRWATPHADGSVVVAHAAEGWA
jgi:hypothetical protein